MLIIPSVPDCDNYLQYYHDPRISYLLKLLNLADVQILKGLWFVDGVVMFWCHNSGSANGGITVKCVCFSNELYCVCAMKINFFLKKKKSAIHRASVLAGIYSFILSLQRLLSLQYAERSFQLSPELVQLMNRHG